MHRLSSFFNALYSLRNRFDYGLRQASRWNRGGLALGNQPKDNLFADLPLEQRAQAEQQEAALRAQYRLEALYQHSSRDNYRENLYYLQLLQHAFERSQAALPDPLQAVDIGPSSWFYVRALERFLRLWQAPGERTLELAGYEADPYRVYQDLYARRDHALAYCAGLQGVSYIPTAFTPLAQGWDLALMFFPFVFLKDHLEWGLPQELHRPGELLAQAWESLRPGGVLLVVNQGEPENQAQQALLAAAGITPRAQFRFESPLYRYSLARCVHVAVR